MLFLIINLLFNNNRLQNCSLKLNLEELFASQKFSRPPYRYSEASLVKKLEELGIGRPSTYAPTISTVQNRGYVEKGSTEAKSRDVIKVSICKGVISEKTLGTICLSDKGQRKH